MGNFQGLDKRNEYDSNGSHALFFSLNPNLTPAEESPEANLVSYMTADELSKAQEALHEEIKQTHKKGNFDNGYILDGVADIQGYLNSKPKIAWILKEAWDEKNGGNWDLTKDVLAGRDQTNTAGIPTFRKVAYTTWGIHASSEWDDIPWIWNDASVPDAIKKVAWLNVSKVAGATNTPSDRLDSLAPKWEEILAKQLDIYRPDIIILGNTYEWVKDLLEIDGKKPFLKEDSAWGYRKDNGQLVIWTYHPGVIMKDEKYVNDIINLIKKFNDEKIFKGK